MAEPMILLEAVEDIAKLAFIVAGLYLSARLYAQRRQPTWTEPLDRRRVVVLCLFALVATAIKVTEDNGTSLSKRSQDFALMLFEALALDVARLCQQAVWLRPSFHRARFATIGSPWQYQLCDCSQ